MMNLQDIYDAHERIRDYALWTPVMTSSTIDRMTECQVFFKCENFQRVGAFKFRGALNTVSQLTEWDRDRGVIAHSSGNHAQALALAASLSGIKATIVMPKNSPKVKVEATRDYGAEIVFCENSTESRVQVANELIEKHDYVLIHPYDNEQIIAGAGTATLELIEEVKELDYLFAPVGGGGLLSGSSIAMKGLLPKSVVIGVEPANADDAFRSFRDGKIYPSINPNTIADGLRTQLSELTFRVIKQHVDSIITVSEEEIITSMRLIWERMKMVVEPSGAVALAGLLHMKSEFSDKRVGVIISGGNIDLTEFFTKLL